MPVPVALATLAATGSLVTSIKSAIELRKMMKRKEETRLAEDEAPRVFNRLRRAYKDGYLTSAEYYQWYEKFMVAKIERDLPALRRIRAHMRVLEENPQSRTIASRSSSTSRSRDSSRSRESRERRELRDRELRELREYRDFHEKQHREHRDHHHDHHHRESRDSRESSRYRDDQSQSRTSRESSRSSRTYEDRDRGRRHSFSYAPEPQSAGSIEYFPEPGRRVGATPDQFIRLQRQATATYPRPTSPAAAAAPAAVTTGFSDVAFRPAPRSSTVHFESPRIREKKRRDHESERRRGGYETDGEDEWYNEKYNEKESRGRKR